MRCHAEDDCCGESYGEYRDPHLQLHRLAGGSAIGLSATGAWAILVSLDGAAADDLSSMRLILKASETFLRHWQNRPLTEFKTGHSPRSEGPGGVQKYNDLNSLRRGSARGDTYKQNCSGAPLWTAPGLWRISNLRNSKLNARHRARRGLHALV